MDVTRQTKIDRSGGSYDAGSPARNIELRLSCTKRHHEIETENRNGTKGTKRNPDT